MNKLFTADGSLKVINGNMELNVYNSNTKIIPITISFVGNTDLLANASNTLKYGDDIILLVGGTDRGTTGCEAILSTVPYIGSPKWNVHKTITVQNGTAEILQCL